MAGGDRRAGCRPGDRDDRLHRSASPDLWFLDLQFCPGPRKYRAQRACDSFWSPNWAQDRVISSFFPSTRSGQVLLFHLKQVNYFLDHPAHSRVILMFNCLMHAMKTKRPYRCLLILGITNRTANQGHSQGLATAFLLRHFASSVPRMATDH